MIGTKIQVNHEDPAKHIGEVTIVDANELMDKVVLAVDGKELMSKETIEALGWIKVPDRGMEENNGYLFYKGHWVLRFWTPAPRFELSFKNSVAFDSAIADPANFGPGKQLEIGLLKEKMIAYAIL